MDILEIIDGVKKYHYMGCGKKSCKILASSDSQSDAKKKLIKFLKPHEDNIIDTVIYLVTIKQSKKDWTPKDKLLPGPIIIIISEYFIKSGIKLKEFSSGINNQIFITKKYLEKNNGIDIDDVLKQVFKFNSRKLKQGMMEKNLL